MQKYLSSVDGSCGTISIRGNERFRHGWKPDDEAPWACLTIVHGFGDHGGRYAGMGTTLASLGVAVQAIDLVGHGQSPGRRGCIASYEQLLDEVEESLTYSILSFPRIPHFLFGQSMGGNLVLNLALRRSESIRRARGIVCGSPLLRAFSMPKERFMDAGRWLATKIPNWRIKAPVNVATLSNDRRAQDAYLRDRFVHRNMSLRLATNLIDSGLWALENASMLKTPALLMHGLEDTLTCPKASKEFADASNGMASFRGWSGCRHDLHDELQRERVFDYLILWMKQKCIASFKMRRSVSGIAA